MKKSGAANKKTKVVKGAAGKKVKSAAKRKATSAAVKKVKSPAKKKATSVVKKKINKSVKGKVKPPVLKPILPETTTHGADLHFMPEHGTNPAVTKFEARKAENIFHHREEVALHQENEKVKQAMSSRKTVKSSYNRGQGSR
ncbi:MAG: hypothetical protein SH857_02380 [Chitinophagales bacterium]|mgnify:CR=1 FL=1|nr:hypothetical protein [Chitinophagales bacterium]